MCRISTSKKSRHYPRGFGMSLCLDVYGNHAFIGFADATDIQPSTKDGVLYNIDMPDVLARILAEKGEEMSGAANAVSGNFSECMNVAMEEALKDGDTETVDKLKAIKAVCDDLEVIGAILRQHYNEFIVWARMVVSADLSGLSNRRETTNSA